MIHSLKAIGLALVAVFVLSAIAAAGASAEYDAEIDLGVEKGGLFGELDGEVTFTRQERPITCKEAEFRGDAEDGDTEFTSKEAAFAECGSLFKSTATVNMNGCNLYFYFTADTEDVFTALGGLKCPEEGSVIITVFSSMDPKHTGEPLCEYALPEQEGLTTIELTNLEPEGGTKKEWIRAHVNLAGIASTRTKGGLLNCGSALDEKGTLEGTFKVKGTNSSKEEVDLTVITDE